MTEGKMEEGTDEKHEKSEGMSSENEVNSKRKSKSKHKKKHKSKSKKRKKRRHRSRSPLSASSKSPSPTASPKTERDDEGKSDNDGPKSGMLGPGEAKGDGNCLDQGDFRSKDGLLQERDVGSQLEVRESSGASPDDGDKGQSVEKGTILGKGEEKSPEKGHRSRSHSRSSRSYSPPTRKRSRSRSLSGERSEQRKRSRSPSVELERTTHSREKVSSSGKRSRRSRSSSQGHSRRSSTRRRLHSQGEKDSPSPRRSDHRQRSRSRSTGRTTRSCSRSRRGSVARSRRSRSHSRRRSGSRSRDRKRSRSPGYSHTRRRSRSRSRRCRESRSHSKSRGRKRSRSRSRSTRRRRSRSHGRSRGGRRNRSRSRSRGRRSARSRSRSQGHRRMRSRSRSRGHQRTRSHSQSRVRRRTRSRSRSRGRRRTRSRSRSRGRRRTRSRTRSMSQDKRTAANGEASVLVMSTAATTTNSSVPDKPASSETSSLNHAPGKKSIAELTAFCKRLTEGKEEDNQNVTEDSTEKKGVGVAETTAHHPFLVKPAAEIYIPPVLLPPVRLLRLHDPSKPLPEQFPVSCGTKHREKEVLDGSSVVNTEPVHTSQDAGVFNKAPVEKIDMSALVTRRMEAQRRLSVNPNDLEAKLTLQELEMKLQNWCQSNVKPGQYTGQLVKSLLPSKDLQGGNQAWAKKDMFQNLMPLSGGVGMKLMQKMGWQPGQVLGRRGEGYAEPIAVQVKIDRKGLSSNLEKMAPKKTSVLDVQGKHPVSALSEYCSKRKWPLPDFKLVFDHGAPHSRQFLFKVIVKDMEYQPAVVSNNKKQAKAEAAVYALKALGLMPENAKPQY